MREIRSNRLWIGNARDARDLKCIFEHEIRAVVDLAYEEPPARLGREIVYCRVPLIDGAENPPDLLRFAIRTVTNLVRSQIPTLVACSLGMSRSPIISFAALAMVEGRPIRETLLDANLESLDLMPGLWEDVESILGQMAG